MSMSSVPSLYNPKKRRANVLDLEEKTKALRKEEEKAKKVVKARGAFNSEFYNGASRVEEIAVKRLRVESDISFSEFTGEREQWEKSEEAKKLFEQIRAKEYRTEMFKKRAEALSTQTSTGRLKELFMKLFATSPIGMGIKSGEGRRRPRIQSLFRRDLLRDSRSLDESGKYAWCPILKDYFLLSDVTAAHIFSYKHGQTMMDVIFGKSRPKELFSCRNGIIIHSTIKRWFDSGVFAIVPDLPERPTVDMISGWTNKEVRNFKLRIIDSTFSRLHDGVITKSGKTWKDLDNQRLEFKGPCRPAARYLYFHYCLQVLRRAWKCGPGEKAAISLCDEFGKPVWATPGRYIGRKMLKVFVETLGQEYKDLLRGSACATGVMGHATALIEAATAQIADSAEDASMIDGNEDESIIEESEDEFMIEESEDESMIEESEDESMTERSDS